MHARARSCVRCACVNACIVASYSHVRLTWNLCSVDLYVCMYVCMHAFLCVCVCVDLHTRVYRCALARFVSFLSLLVALAAIGGRTSLSSFPMGTIPHGIYNNNGHTSVGDGSIFIYPFVFRFLLHRHRHPFCFIVLLFFFLPFSLAFLRSFLPSVSPYFSPFFVNILMIFVRTTRQIYHLNVSRVARLLFFMRLLFYAPFRMTI